MKKLVIADVLAHFFFVFSFYVLALTWLPGRKKLIQYVVERGFWPSLFKRTLWFCVENIQTFWSGLYDITRIVLYVKTSKKSFDLIDENFTNILKIITNLFFYCNSFHIQNKIARKLELDELHGKMYNANSWMVKKTLLISKTVDGFNNNIISVTNAYHIT